MGGTNYTISGVSQLLSVPYALYAEKTNRGSLPIVITDSIIQPYRGNGYTPTGSGHLVSTGGEIVLAKGFCYSKSVNPTLSDNYSALTNFVQTSANATGDGADEDGITLPASLITGTTASVTVNASGSGNLTGWVDFNLNGNFLDAGEKVFNDVAVVAGNNVLTFAVPAGATVGTSFGRFRIATIAGLGVGGFSTDGLLIEN